MSTKDNAREIERKYRELIEELKKEGLDSNFPTIETLIKNMNFWGMVADEFEDSAEQVQMEEQLRHGG